MDEEQGTKDDRASSPVISRRQFLQLIAAAATVLAPRASFAQEVSEGLSEGSKAFEIHQYLIKKLDEFELSDSQKLNLHQLILEGSLMVDKALNANPVIKFLFLGEILKLIEGYKVYVDEIVVGLKRMKSTELAIFISFLEDESLWPTLKRLVEKRIDDVGIITEDTLRFVGDTLFDYRSIKMSEKLTENGLPFGEDWARLNRPDGIEAYSRMRFSWKQRPDGFVNWDARKNVSNDFSETYLMARLYPYALGDIIGEDFTVADKVVLMERAIIAISENIAALKVQTEQDSPKLPDESSSPIIEVRRDASYLIDNKLSVEKVGTYAVRPVGGRTASSPEKPVHRISYIASRSTMDEERGMKDDEAFSPTNVKHDQIRSSSPAEMSKDRKKGDEDIIADILGGEELYGGKNIQTLTAGKTNATFIVRTIEGTRIFQRINHVYDQQHLLANMMTFNRFQQSGTWPDYWEPVVFLPFAKHDGQLLVKDVNGHLWRMMSYIDGLALNSTADVEGEQVNVAYALGEGIAVLDKT